MTEEQEVEHERHWHLDRRVPLALIFTIAGQTAGLLIWGANLSTRVNQLETQMIALSPQSERIIRLETKMDSIFGSLSEIKALIQRK